MKKDIRSATLLPTRVAAPPARWLYLTVSTVSMLFLGIIYAWSILKAPLAAEFGWNASQLALNFTITMCCFCIGGILSGFALRRVSSRIVLLFAGLLSCTGFLWASRMTGSLFHLYLSYGVLAGTGIGIAYNAILSATNAWYPDKKGLSSGVQMMSFGASSLIFGSIAGYLIELPAFGWRNTYLLLGIILGGVLMLALLVLRFPPEGTDLPKSVSPKSKQGVIEANDYTLLEMVKRSSFWRFFMFSITMVAIGNTVLSLAKDLAISIGAGAALSTTLVGILSICNGLGRLFSGMLFDRIGRKNTMLIGNLITIAAPIVTLSAILLSSVPLCTVGLCLCGISYGFCPPISSAFIMTFYGQKNYPTNFSIANTMLIPSSFVATLAGAILNATGSYIPLFILLTCFAVISLMLNLSIRQP